MAVKNLQTVVLAAAKTFGVTVTGTECTGTMGIVRPASQSLPRQPRLGRYPMRAHPEAKADNDPAAAQAALWAGRSRSSRG